MKKKQIMIICGSLAMIAALSSALTLAYLGVSAEKKNKLNIDKGNAAVSEVFSSPEYQLTTNTTTKEVAVQNSGKEPCYVRVYVGFTDSVAQSKTKLSPDGTNFYSFEDFINYINNDTNSKWKYESGDNALGGYFYYTEKVPGNGKTSTLFKSVQTDFAHGERNSATLSDIDMISDFGIIVYSETVQTSDNGVEKTYQEAWQSFLRVPAP